MQKLVDPLAPVRPDVGDGYATGHGFGRPIGGRPHKALQRLFGQVRAGETIAGREKIEAVGQTWARIG